jgi:hypothetical protein
MMREDLIKIQQLQVLAELKLNSERARLKDIAREEERPNAVLDAISQEKERHTGVVELEVSQSTLAGMDGKWRVWAERETRAAMQELARIAKKREDQLRVTNQAFGRTEALKSLVKKAKET